MSPNSPLLNSGPAWQVAHWPRPRKRRRPRRAACGIGLPPPAASLRGQRLAKAVEGGGRRDQGFLPGGDRLGEIDQELGVIGRRWFAEGFAVVAGQGGDAFSRRALRAALPPISRGSRMGRRLADQRLSCPPSQPNQRWWRTLSRPGVLRVPAPGRAPWRDHPGSRIAADGRWRRKPCHWPTAAHRRTGFGRAGSRPGCRMPGFPDRLANPAARGRGWRCARISSSVNSIGTPRPARQTTVPGRRQGTPGGRCAQRTRTSSNRRELPLAD
jgi:hypothetical protein